MRARQVASATPIPACAICKRLPGYGHDEWCTPERRANADADRLQGFAAAPVVIRYTEPTADPLPDRMQAAMPEVLKRRAAASVPHPEPVIADAPQPYRRRTDAELIADLMARIRERTGA